MTFDLTHHLDLPNFTQIVGLTVLFSLSPGEEDEANPAETKELWLMVKQNPTTDQIQRTNTSKKDNENRRRKKVRKVNNKTEEKEFNFDLF